MFVALILSKIRAYQRYREAICEPMLLTDREFGDVGFSPNYIDVIAPERQLVIHLLNKSTSKQKENNR
jgi:uncharacterized protein YjiS (DUF1127 family)